MDKANLRYFNISHIWKIELSQYQHTMLLTRQQKVSSKTSACWLTSSYHQDL